LRGLDITPSILPQENIKRGDPSQKAFGTTLRVGSERGLFPLSIELRRFLASLEMTGYENHFFLLPLGKSWKGGEALVSILGDPSLRSGRPELRSVRKGEALVPILGDTSLCSV
jgi:hypothetical protein